MASPQLTCVIPLNELWHSCCAAVNTILSNTHWLMHNKIIFSDERPIFLVAPFDIHQKLIIGWSIIRIYHNKDLLWWTSRFLVAPIDSCAIWYKHDINAGPTSTKPAGVFLPYMKQLLSCLKWKQDDDRNYITNSRRVWDHCSISCSGDITMWNLQYRHQKWVMCLLREICHTANKMAIHFRLHMCHPPAHATMSL
jgi:hypothetical protein